MSQKLDWRPAGGVAALATKDGRRLQVMATCNLLDALWMVVALESREDMNTLDGLFEEHAHATVAENVPMHRAIEAAEAYVAAWLEGDAEAMERCKCREIAPEPPEVEKPVFDEDLLKVRGREVLNRVLGPGQDNPIMLERIGQPVEYCSVCGRSYVGIPCHMQEPTAREPVHALECDLGEDCTCGALEAALRKQDAEITNRLTLHLHTQLCPILKGGDCTCGANDRVPADPLEALKHHTFCSVNPCICKEIEALEKPCAACGAKQHSPYKLPVCSECGHTLAQIGI